jgi:4-amino-4-deoxy-L-arabinose transferase-like glycosyltransferase
MLPVIGGTLLLLNPSDRQTFGRLFASGLLFGVGLLMKQPAVFFILFGAIYLVSTDIRRRLGLKRIFLRNLTFGGGVITPFGLTCFVLWYAGVFNKFWFWTINYARQYGSLIPISAAPQVFMYSVKKVIGPGWALWMLAGLGLMVGLWDKRTRASTGFLLGLLVFSALALCAGFHFRQHYFILVLPAVSLLVGVAISKVSDFLREHLSVLSFTTFFLFGAALGLPILWKSSFFFRVSPDDACRMIYQANPFPESVRVAEYVRQHTSPNDTIAVLGSEPQIYFYAKRHSATGYIYTYGLMEPQKYAHQMQHEMIREI